MSFELVTVKSEPEDLDISAYIKQEVFDPKIEIEFEFPPIEQGQISACIIKEEIQEESDITCSIKEESDSICSIEENINDCRTTDIFKVEIRSEDEEFNCQHNNCKAVENIFKNSIISDATQNIPEVVENTGNIEDAHELANPDDVQDTSLLTIENKRNIPENMSYICDYCGIAFKEKTKLIAHITSHNINEGARKININVNRTCKFSCLTCDCKFATKSELINHNIRIHDLILNYVACKECDYKTKHNYRLKRHVKTHSGLKPYQCAVCDNFFCTSDSLKVHMRIHSGEKPYKCTLCDANFCRNNSLKKHLRIHSGDRPYKCTACDAKFRDTSSLKRHTKIHSEDKPYECSACDTKFRDRSSLKRHTKIHSEDKPYECSTCNAKFRDSSSLSRHAKVHSGDKPYDCSACGAKYRDSSSLKRHMRIHSRESPHV